MSKCETMQTSFIWLIETSVWHSFHTMYCTIWLFSLLLFFFFHLVRRNCLPSFIYGVYVYKNWKSTRYQQKWQESLIETFDEYRILVADWWFYIANEQCLSQATEYLCWEAKSQRWWQLSNVALDGIVQIIRYILESVGFFSTIFEYFVWLLSIDKQYCQFHKQWIWIKNENLLNTFVSSDWSYHRKKNRMGWWNSLMSSRICWLISKICA